MLIGILILAHHIKERNHGEDIHLLFFALHWNKVFTFGFFEQFPICFPYKTSTNMSSEQNSLESAKKALKESNNHRSFETCTN